MTVSNGRGLVRGRVKRKMQNHHLYNDIPGLTGSHLYEAARSNDPVGVKLCLLATDTCDINYQQKPDLWTSLIRAAHDGHTKIVEMLLEKKPDVNMKTALGRTALHMAAHGNRLEIARMLIDARADVIAADVAGRTPVDLARSYGDDTPLIKVMEPVAEVKRRSGAAGPRTATRSAWRSSLRPSCKHRSVDASERCAASWPRRMPCFRRTTNGAKELE